MWLTARNMNMKSAERYYQKYFVRNFIRHSEERIRAVQVMNPVVSSHKSIPWRPGISVNAIFPFYSPSLL